MTTPTKTKCLKKLYLLFLLYAGIGFAQPTLFVETPTPLTVCDYEDEGFETFDLTVKNQEILNGWNSDEYSVFYYESLSNSEGDANPIDGLYLNTIAYNQTVYVRVVRNLDTSYALTTLDLIVHTYCSFTPSENYNTITGTIRYDDENNGCDGDLAQSYAKVLITDGQNSGSSFIDNFGNYAFYTQAGSFEITPQVQNPNYFTITPAIVGIDFADNNDNVRIQDFCIAPNGIHPDLEVILTPIFAARPGQDATYKLIYKNKGNQTQTGSINLSFDDSKTDFVSAIPEVANQGLNSLIWIYSSLLPFETREINFTLNVNSPQENPAVNVDDVLNFTASINFAQGDETPTDNFFNLNQIVVNSFDPNNKICLEGRTILVQRIGDYLHYNINFENIGIADAVNVVVKDIIDTSKLDINSFQLLYASDTLQTKVDNNKIEFIFKDINLRSTATQPIGGHGNVLFKIRTLPTLQEGDEVVNNANIYFDYNAPIITNDARTTFGTLSNSVFIKDNSVFVYPNPANSKINVKADNAIKSIEIYDVQGRILEIISGESKESLIDISNKANGVYFFKITTNKGSKIEKVVKE